MTEREKPTGGKPAGLPDTGTERIQILSHHPHERKIVCECLFPCSVCQCRDVPGEIIAGSLYRFHILGTHINSHFFMIGEIKDKIAIICNGCATGEVLHQATGHAVVVALDVYNLHNVTDYFRTKGGEWNDWKIIIAADDNYNDEDNPGMAEATEAALCYDGLLAVPIFINHKSKFDFYDMSVEQGLDAVRLCIEAASIPQEWRG